MVKYDVTCQNQALFAICIQSDNGPGTLGKHVCQMLQPTSNTQVTTDKTSEEERIARYQERSMCIYLLNMFYFCYHLPYRDKRNE